MRRYRVITGIITRCPAAAVTLAVIVAVGWACTYAGMHHLSDVIGGALLGPRNGAVPGLVHMA